ncbi:MAG: NHLP bacteriocin export ABC transporter permease/ATPase subunit [Oscillospiraceae bacterium]|nr:NHLP bacteriocin export ABC transporter permease/ATPase subunit [Oscillospiraceae bacterium]
MGWFDQQIRQRKLSDQEVLEESLIRMASAVLGKQRAGQFEDQRIVTKAAIDELLKYYHFKPVEIPDNIRDPDEQLEYCLRPHGIMRRSVELKEDWYKDSFGPMIAFRKEDGLPVALIPKPFIGYSFRDAESGKTLSLNRKTAEQFDRDAWCFYRPLPLRELTIPDLMKYLWDCLSTGDYVTLIVLTFAVTALGLLMTSLTKALTGFVRDTGHISLLIGTSVFMISTLIASQLISASKALMMSRLDTKTSLSVEAAMMMRVMNLPASFFRNYSSGELSSRYGAVNQLCSLLLDSVFNTGISSLMSLMFIAQIFRYAPALVTPALIIILATIVVSILTALTQMRLSRQIMEKGAKESGMSFALLSGIQKIKIAGAEKRAFARWANAYTESASPSYNPPFLIKANSSVSMAITLAGTIALYYLAVKTRVDPSEYIAFNTAFGAVSAAFSSLTTVALSVARIKPILEMAEPILKTAPESAEGKTMVTRLNGNIELSNVSFRYRESQPWIVDDMSLKIRAGEYVAIVGKTGCGKSTLVRLMLGFETPDKGAIYYDGADLSGLDLRSLRRRIGTVTQDGSLFNGDIYSNIVITAPQLTLDDAWAAAEIAGIADDIRAMPMGMQTIISEGQGGISGGQKQRLMIARAVAPKPKILIFDEATSALDNRTQKQVSEALDALKCTRIVIAHRLSTIKNCDRILVLDSGKILEDGTYDELIAKNGFFADLVARQRLDV